MAAVENRRMRLWQDKIATEVEITGNGPPLVFLHGPWGQRNRDCLDRLAGSHRVYAPRHPGITPGDPDAIHELDHWLDLVVYYGELLDCLGLDAVSLVGHSFGGMLACEIAAAMPGRVKKLVLIAPLGLWRDDLPVKNRMILPEDQRRAALFADPAGPAAERFSRCLPIRRHGSRRRPTLSGRRPAPGNLSGRSRTRVSKSGSTGFRRQA
jgi:pimeloyl-ACP methyl ester carboxylesterase